MALFPTPLLLSVAFLTFFPRHTTYKETVENGDGGWTASQLIFPHTKRRRPKNYSAGLPFGGSVTKKIGGKARSLFGFFGLPSSCLIPFWYLSVFCSVWFQRRDLRIHSSPCVRTVLWFPVFSGKYTSSPLQEILLKSFLSTKLGRR